ncbi:MAG: hypothetical protein PF450_04620, partial [Bacteroidales bacterium]|nr:hypothetical protein [Bacteroidales bacterium]
MQSYRIEDEGSEIPKEEYRNYIKQKPNKRFLGWKFWLSIYNLSGENAEKWHNRYLKKLGEPPVSYSEDLSANSAQQLEMFLFNKGFFDSKVSDTASVKNRKVKVLYQIETGNPYMIRNIDYFFEDASLSKYIMTDSVSPILKTGQQFDADKFQSESSRIETLLRNAGYYNFTSDYVYYEADSSIGNYQVDIVMGIKNFPITDSSGKVTRRVHPKYRIRNVYLKVEPPKAGVRSLILNQEVDTSRYDEVYLINNPSTKIKHELIMQKNYIIPGDLYSARREEQTYRNLTALSAFRLVDYNFWEVPGGKNELDCEIRLLPSVRQAFTGSIEGTTSGGNIGAAGNLNFQHRNFFGGSEKFDITLLGAIET